MVTVKYSRSIALGLLLILATTPFNVSAQETVPKNPGVRPGPRQPVPNKYLVVPGLEPLSLESVQQEINLTPEQKQQLKQLSNGFMTEMREQQANMQNEMKAIGNQPEEEQDKRAAALGQAMDRKMGQLAQSTRQKAETILSRDQVSEIHEIAFRLFVAARLTDPGTQQHLGLDPRQQQQLMAIYEQSAEQLHKVQRQTASQLLKTLTPEQQTELRSTMDNPPQRRQQ